MVCRRKSYVRASVFRRHPKMDDATLIRLVYFFCNGIGVKALAAALRLSRKSVRAHYLDLRSRLRKPKFARWHALHTALPRIGDPQRERLVKGGLIEAMAACSTSGCAENHASGNRANRLCRSCPLSHAFPTARGLADALGAVDAVTALYRRLGIREDCDGGRMDQFLERLIHASTLASVRANSRRLPSGLLDPKDSAHLGVGTLLAMLMDDLADDTAPRLPRS